MKNKLLTYFGIDVNTHLIDGSVDQKKEHQILVFYISISMACSLVSFIFLFYYTLNNILFSILLTIFGVVFLLNMYRLVFSISIGELDKRSSLFDIILFVAKRSIILVVLAILSSITLQSILLEPVFKRNLNTYKEKIINDYRLTLKSTTFQEKNQLNVEFDETKNYLHNLGRDNEISILESKLNDELSIISLKEDELLNNYKNEINNTPLLMARMNILLNDFSLIFLMIAFITIVIYLYPVYYYVRSDAFSTYDRKYIKLQNQIILSEFQYFKRNYTKAFINSIGEEVYFSSKYEDPPFNLIPKKPNYQRLTKGSLASWYKNFVKNV